MVRKLRKSVLYKRLPNSYAKYKEDCDDKTLHFILNSNDLLISALSLIRKPYIFKLNLNCYQIRGMLTQSKYRNIGYGSFLLKYIIDMAKKNDNIDLLWCNSRKNSVQFYEKNGFKKSSGCFLIKKIGIHYKMYFDCRI